VGLPPLDPYTLEWKVLDLRRKPIVQISDVRCYQTKNELCLSFADRAAGYRSVRYTFCITTKCPYFDHTFGNSRWDFAFLIYLALT